MFRGLSPVPHEKLAAPGAALNRVHLWRDAEQEWRMDLAAAAMRPLTLMNTELEGAEVDEEGVPAVFVFIKEGNAMQASWENTVVGRAEVGKAALRLETNSVRRASVR